MSDPAQHGAGHGEAHHGEGHHAPKPSLGLVIGALGVVYGDIGTNPLFAMREAFESHHAVALNEANVVGLLSLMFWSLLLVVTLKYLTIVMRADNDGEGGILALAALVTGDRPDAGNRGRTWVLILIAIFGAALLYGDGMVTPAISVLSAVEGTTVASASLEDWVVPLACVILVGLFAVQRKGTEVIGKIFGPVMVVWFLTLGVMGAGRLAQEPSVLRAVWPGHAVRFFADNGGTGFLVLGAVILVVVGGEALYADMGHFGRKPIMLGWYGLVLPCLLLVYFGQGALLVRTPEAIDNPFFRMAPRAMLYPLVVLATMATVIASQALISGAYSLTHQAMQLGYSPRVQVRHTSEAHMGQIYLPAVNWALLFSCLGLVIGFRHSANLAAAYGLAVSTTMVMTTILFAVVALHRFGWPKWIVFVMVAVFGVVDLAFFGATVFKVPDGGWFPLVVGAIVFTLMTTWRTGRRLVAARLTDRMPRLSEVADSLAERTVPRIPGASAYLFSAPGVAPPSMMASLRHNDSLHEQVLVISVVTEPRPRVPLPRRAEITDLPAGVHQVVLHFGFLEVQNVPQALADRVVMRLGTDLSTLSYVLSRESLRVTSRPGMARWREHLYAFLARNASNAASHFDLPIDQTMELGVVIEL